MRKGKCRAAGGGGVGKGQWHREQDKEERGSTTGSRSGKGTMHREKEQERGSATVSRSGKGTMHREKEQERGNASVSRSGKRDIATGRKSEKEEVPQTEGLIKGKCHTVGGGGLRKEQCKRQKE